MQLEQPPLHVLIIDDDEIDRALIRRSLAKSAQQISTEEACGADEALLLLQQNRYDCVLVDYRLGSIDGLDLLEKIQAENLSSAPLVMISGLEDEQVMLDCLKAGAQDYLLKSEISTSTLLRAIRYALERKHISSEISYLSQHDPLTDLANRSLFSNSVNRALATSKRQNSGFAIFFVDLDHFKRINDSLGHEVGDKLLVALAKRLSDATRGGDVVGRMGGDEFALLIEDAVEHADLVNVAEKLLAEAHSGFKIDEHDLRCTLSIGIATYPHCADSEAGLMKCADLAMYNSKNTGRNRYSFYSEALQEGAQDYLAVKKELSDAFEKNQFELHYQPKISCADGKISGVEALIRWRHPTRGLLAAGEIIPAAESTGLIDKIGDWVLEQSAIQLHDWQCNYLENNSNFTLAINISAYQIRQGDFEKKLLDTFNRYDVDLTQIELELTETAIVEDITLCRKKVQSLSQQGIKWAIDDFGTGYASFRHLQQLPVQTLKIDKSFIDYITGGQRTREIVKAMIVMAKAMEMEVVAEGVESMEQLEVLAVLGSDTLQGYYFSKALPVNQINALLAQRDKHWYVPSALHSLEGIKVQKTTAPESQEVTILLVDDDDIDAMTIERALRKIDEPTKLVRAVDGIQALEILHAGKLGSGVATPYLMLLDLNMPRMNGLELLEEIRKDKDLQSSVIFVLTTSSDDKDRLAAYKNHVAGYLIKSETGVGFQNLIQLLTAYHKTVQLPKSLH